MHTLRLSTGVANALFGAVSLSAALAGCGTDGSTPSDYVGVGPEAATAADASVTAPNITQNPDASATPNPEKPFEQCAGEVTEAKKQGRPVNVVWVIDSSSSMEAESRAVQDNINSFAQQIGKVGSDYRVVLITGKSAFNLTVPAPLGTDAAHFLYVDHYVDSEEPLEALNTEIGKYKSFLLKDAVTHFVVVTDDESNITSTAFLAQMRADLGADATFKVHAIASPFYDPKIEICRKVFGVDVCSMMDRCATAANPGKQHYAAAGATGGLTFSVCTEDWTTLFSKLGEAVSAPIPCELAVPQPPAGQTLDPSKVNLLFKGLQQATAASIARVQDAAACGTQPGWFYDNAATPTRMSLCPASCTAVEQGGALEIKLGCASDIR